jgi:hypothetical protein
VRDRLGNGDVTVIDYLRMHMHMHYTDDDFIFLVHLWKHHQKHSTARLRGPKDLEPTDYCS